LNKLTIAVDVRLNDVNARQAWVSRWGANAQFILRCQGGANPGSIIFIVADGLNDPGRNAVKTPDNILRPGFPARIVVVFDTGDVKVYVNGAVFNTTTIGTIPTSLTSGSEADLMIGTDTLSSFVEDGLMSRLSIWAGTALTPEQVANDFNTWIGVDPASGEPVTPTHAWRLDEASGTRHDCIGNIDLSDNNGTGSEAHITQVDDLSGNGFHAIVRPINGPTLGDNGLGGKPTIRHSAGNNQFLICGLVSGPAKPPAWSLYTLAMCASTTPASGQLSHGLFNTFGIDGLDRETWIVCVLSDVGGSHAPEGSFGIGCGDDTHYNQSNSPASTYPANVWFQLTGIFPGGVGRVNAWFNGVPQNMTYIDKVAAGPCVCAGSLILQLSAPLLRKERALTTQPKGPTTTTSLMANGLTLPFVVPTRLYSGKPRKRSKEIRFSLKETATRERRGFSSRSNKRRWSCSSRFAGNTSSVSGRLRV
jgi:hypothetical protein